MGRTTKYNNITTPELLSRVNPKNVQLKNDFLAYLRSLQRSEGTIRGYANDLDIVFVFLLERCNNKYFIDVKKREFVALQSWLIDEHENSPARVRRIKAVISSLSNFITNILADEGEDEFENYKPIIKAIENPVNAPVRDKLILTDAQCEAMLDKLVEQKRYEQACFLALAFYSGRRKSELMRFKVEHFNDDHLICDGALYSTIEKIRSKGRGKNGKMIVFYVLPKFKPYFDLWMTERARLGIESEWLFPNRNKPEEARASSSADAWTVIYSKVLSDIVGEETSFYMHSARHWLTSHLSRCGLPQNVIQAYFQWSSLELVSIYDDNDATDSFGDYFTADGIKGAEKKSFADI